MVQFRVKAFFMHESEQAAAERAVDQAIITDVERTDGYLMGVVDEKVIPALVEQGLVITPIERLATPEQEAPGGTTRSVRATTVNRDRTFRQEANALGISITGKDVAAKILSPLEESAQFCVVRLNGPLTEQRRGDLERQKVSLLERLSSNKYTARLTATEARNLAAQTFVDTIRLYSEDDTLLTSQVGPESPPSRATRGAKASDVPSFTIIHAVRLHRVEDVPVVKSWLKEKGREPLSESADVLRVALPRGGNVVTQLAKLPEVATVEEVLPSRPLDRMARGILRLEGDGLALGYEGEGELIGVADTGLDQDHPDFQGRIAGVIARGRPGPPGNSDDTEGHGTHVAGCALGDGQGSAGEVRGAAPKAKLFFQSILDANGGLGGLPANLGELFSEAYQAGVRIHNNSWGAFGYARYSITSLDVDRFVAANPDMLIVIAAGNDGLAVARGGTKTNSDAGFVDWPSVAAPATAKNGLTVGASRNARKEGGYAKLKFGEAWKDRYPKAPIADDFISGDPNCLAAFSSRGPSDANQIKPDLVAPGTDIAATRSRKAPLYKFWGAYPNNAHYAYMGGTSMAAPYVAGCAALVREYFVKTAKWTTPSAALLKATLINGTKRLMGHDAVAPLPGEPNFHQGFGRLNMAASIPSPMSRDLKLEFVDTWKTPALVFQKTGQRLRWKVQIGDKLPLRICLVWTDIPFRGLQNSLLLLVDNESGEKFTGNGNAAATLKIAGMIADPNNNVQVVRIEREQIKAGTFTIAVTATNLLQPPQAFALVVTGDLRSPLLIS
jgi:serine protease AprX